MSIFRPKTSILTKTHFSHIIFFRTFYEKSPAAMPLFGKKGQFCKSYIILWQKKSIGCPFLQNFHKNYCPNAHVVSKRRPISKKYIALMPIFCRKNVHSLRSNVLMSLFLAFTINTPCCHAHIWSKNRQFCQNYIILWIKKVNRMLFFFPIFHGKVASLMPIFCQESVHSQKNPLLSSPYFIKKRPFSQKHCALMSVFQNFYEKLPAVKPIFGPKNVNSVKITRQKNQYHNHFFRFCTEK